ncbi:hypothetical protein ACPXA0_25805, partial [Escherichia coli]|uniref:hypothetical protein n=1 Tax=Escherichia coli TaxID=562 RepID=UPI003CE4ACD0
SKAYTTTQKKEKKQKQIKDLQKLPVDLPDTIQLFCQELQTLNIIENSISLIFTDPPYDQLPLYEILAEEAIFILCDGGSLLTYVPQDKIGKVIGIMESHGLKFHWP